MSSLHDTFLSRKMAIEIHPGMKEGTVHRTIIPRKEGGWMLIHHQKNGNSSVCPSCGSLNCIEKDCPPQILTDDQVADRLFWSVGLTRTTLLEEGIIHV